jgi:DNA-binding MarR family transcriptional regulator
MATPTRLVPPSRISSETLSDELRVAIGRVRRRVAGVASSDDLTSSQASVLLRLAKSEATTAAGLAALEGVRPQSIAVVLSALEERGLISRSPHPSDGRRQLVELTDAGRARADGNREARREWLTQRIRELYDDEERAVLAEAVLLLDRIVRS